MNQEVFEALANWMAAGVHVDFEALGFAFEVITVEATIDLAN